MTQPAETPPKNGADYKPSFVLKYYDRETRKLHTITGQINDIDKFRTIFYDSDDDDNYIQKFLNAPSSTIGVESIYLAESDPPKRFIMTRRVADLVVKRSLHAWLDEDGTGETKYYTKEDAIKALQIENFTSARLCPVCGYDFRTPSYVDALDKYVPLLCPMCRTIVTPIA